MRAFETLLTTGFGEWLAGKSGTENIVSGQRGDIKSADITEWTDSKIFLVNSSEILINLTGEDAAMPQLIERNMKASESCK